MICEHGIEKLDYSCPECCEAWRTNWMMKQLSNAKPYPLTEDNLERYVLKY